MSAGTSRTFETAKPSWLYFVLVLLMLEKIIQHIFVTLAFLFNWGDIASTVVVSPTVLMVLGGIVAVLFALALWGMLRKQAWALNLAIGLALFDIVGEFVAQGKIDISITVSFLVATILLILSLVYRRRIVRA
jgi:hypothetical protein